MMKANAAMNRRAQDRKARYHMGMLNGYLNEKIEAEKAKGLFAIARAIDGLANAIIQANRERLEALKESEVTDGK